MRSYTQLTENERYQISALHDGGYCRSAIARQLGRDKSTISRELRRNRGSRGYAPSHAEQLARQRRENKQVERIDLSTWRWVRILLEKDWSPEQVSGWLSKEKSLQISHEWIYQYVYDDKRGGGDLHQHLRCQKKRRKRYGSNDRRGQIKGRVSIGERPSVVETRSRVGDWEVDTVIGRPGGSVLVTVVERKTRFSVMALAADKRAKTVTDSLLTAMKPYADKVHTLTYDNGKEFANHEGI